MVNDKLRLSQKYSVKNNGLLLCCFFNTFKYGILLYNILNCCLEMSTVPIQGICLVKIRCADCGISFVKGTMGFTKQVLKVGNGVKPTRGQSVTVHCTGYGKNRNLAEQFWSTKDPGQKPFTFAVGLGQGTSYGIGRRVGVLC
jgi:peptidylprolyl isomerase